MFCPEKNKLNKFKLVRIPKPVEFFGRFGYQSAPSASFSGDEDGSPMKSKIDTLADMEEYDRMMQREEDRKRNE